MCKAPISIGVGSSGLLAGCGLDAPWHFSTLRLALLETRLLYAGQPLHPSAPPVPLHLPPPGQDPDAVWSAATYFATGAFGSKGTWAFGDSLTGDCRAPFPATVGGRLRFIGRWAFLAFKYNPQALQIVSPCGDRRQRGVRVVPQLLCFVRKRTRVARLGNSPADLTGVALIGPDLCFAPAGGASLLEVGGTPWNR
jgi:hypothetical protein